MEDKLNQLNKKKRIAVYGYVRKNTGSCTGASYMVIEELLRRGCEIDFYGKKDVLDLYPQELCQYKNFHFVEVVDEFIPKFVENSVFKFLPESINQLIRSLYIHPLHVKALQKIVFANHQNKKYNLVFFLQLYSLFKLDNIPTISWVQGPPQTEWFYIKKNRKKMILLCGITLYLQLMFFYAVIKSKWSRIGIKESDFIICGSQWSKEMLVASGVENEKIKILPYPIDCDFFKLNVSKKPTNLKTLLWLGRIDPRKRLDLLLEAYSAILRERQDIKLKIFGSVNYAKGYQKLIDNFEFPNFIEYQPLLERSKIPELMAQCDLLIQPSEGENFGSAVAEAMCCGLPVVVGSTNGTKDYISSSSFVFEEYNAESLKAKILEAIQAIEQDREKLVLDARQAAEKNFEMSRIVDRLEKIFQEALMFEKSSSENLPERQIKVIR
jgi:glycosyltransferase involved in cell wall biosynthesis